jgi:hypothetical protein
VDGPRRGFLSTKRRRREEGCEQAARARPDDARIGQISRDSGIRLTREAIVTHKIDPDGGEARDHLVRDLTRSGHVRRLGHRAASINKPRLDCTEEPCGTDGLGAVIERTDSPVSLGRAEVFAREWPYGRGAGASIAPAERHTRAANSSLPRQRRRNAERSAESAGAPRRRRDGGCPCLAAIP